MTPSNPSIGHVYALGSNSGTFSPRELKPVTARHRKLAQMNARMGRALTVSPFFRSRFRIANNHLFLTTAPRLAARLIEVAKLPKLVRTGFLNRAALMEIKGVRSAFQHGRTKPATMGRLYGALDKANEQLIFGRQSRCTMPRADPTNRGRQRCPAPRLSCRRSPAVPAGEQTRVHFRAGPISPR